MRGRLSRGRGYILLFVLGALVLVASMVVGIGVWVRDRSQSESLAHQTVERRLQLQGQLAAALAKIRLDLHWIPRIVKGERVPRDYEVWIPRPAPYRWVFQGQALDIYIHPAAWYPDVNLLDAPALTRLLEALGLSADRAWAAALRIVAKRQLLASQGGFKSYAPLTSLWDDDPSVWLGWSGAPAAPGFLWNVSWGTRSVVTDPNHTPLAVYRAIYNASPSQLRALETARGRAALDKAKEKEIMGEPVPELQAGRTANPNAAGYRVRVALVPVSADQAPSGTAMVVGDVSISGAQAVLQSHLVFHPR